MLPDAHPLVTFILATYNECENITRLVESAIAEIGDPIEIIVVDDNSPDGTAEALRALRDPRVKVICRTRTRGLASAYMRGIIESRGEVVCWMDSDSCHPVSLVPQMIARLKEYDAVVGSRFVEGGSDERDAGRIWASKLITGLARFVLRCKTKDIDSGFIVMKRECLDTALFSPSGYGEYFIEMIYNMERHGLRVNEIGFSFRDREEDEGHSKSFQGWLKFLLLGSKYVLRIMRCRVWPLR